MITKAQLENALKDAMRAGDDLRKNTLRMALSAIRLAEIDKGTSLDEPALLAVLQKEVKSRRESIEDALRANRPDLISTAEAEIAVIETFLPQALSPAELEELARQMVQEVGATSLKEMGQVMKLLMPKLQGRATGDQASQAVRKLLQ
jgi:uncharacterized protein YqeY